MKLGAKVIFHKIQSIQSTKQYLFINFSKGVDRFAQIQNVEDVYIFSFLEKEKRKTSFLLYLFIYFF